jgi:spore coat protein U-like protein
MLNKKLLALATGAALLAGAQSGFAGSLGAGIASYDVALADSCTSASVGGASFGTQATSNPDLLGQSGGGVSVVCPSGLAYRIMVDGGQNASAVTANRRHMFSGVNYISYELVDSSTFFQVGDNNPLDGGYTSPNGPAAWAGGVDGTGNGSWGNYHGFNANVYITDSPVAGTYNDSVGVTVTW